ncbi:kallikrein 1-related peptidase b9 [Tetranychus urticae]|uniref:Peptidase S1 domain-containing protein n=1 Tax=Tetranychus urticae TaxID=32264 RepID=T1KHQ3_TETUR|nr:kallikrein 1-related peptidase b9 [Tetranychus urticae]
MVQLCAKHFLLLWSSLLFNQILAEHLQLSLKPRIYKGEPIEKSKLPWISYLRLFAPDDAFYNECGGVLIDDGHVLTAAHCLYLDNETMVQMKDLYISFNVTDKPLRMKNENPSETFIIHPKFDYSHDWIMENDLAIIKLKSPVGPAIKPICISRTVNPAFGDELEIAGYGSIDDSGSESDSLLYTKVDLIPRDECDQQRRVFVDKQIASGKMDPNKVPELLDTQICAINRKTRGDSCPGDSGGPLVAKTNSSQYSLIGIVTGSWTNCGSPDVPGLYTWVAKFMNWIESVGAKPCIV